MSNKLGFVFMTLSLFGCSGGCYGGGEDLNGGLYKFRDPDAGVTCYTIYDRGISCLRDKP